MGLNQVGSLFRRLGSLAGEMRRLAADGERSGLVLDRAREALELARLGNGAGGRTVTADRFLRAEALLADRRSVGDGLGLLDGIVQDLNGRRPLALERVVGSTFLGMSPRYGDRVLMARPSAPGSGGRHGRPLEKKVRSWLTAIGDSLLRELRQKRIRFSPTARVAQLVPFAVSFDLETGDPISVVSGKRPQMIRTDQGVVVVHYGLQTRRLYVEGRVPGGAKVLWRPQDPAPTRVEPPHEVLFEAMTTPPSSPSVVAEILERINGREPLFPRPPAQWRRKGGVKYLEVDPSFLDENASYAREALEVIIRTAGMTMMGEVIPVPEGGPQALRDWIARSPIPDISVSLAANGGFVGFVYAMPTEASPRGTVYEIGFPWIGEVFRLRYAQYSEPIGPWRSRRVPLGYGGTPNRLQRAVLDHWIGLREYQESVPAGWIVRVNPDRRK